MPLVLTNFLVDNRFVSNSNHELESKSSLELFKRYYYGNGYYSDGRSNSRYAWISLVGLLFLIIFIVFLFNCMRMTRGYKPMRYTTFFAPGPTSNFVYSNNQPQQYATNQYQQPYGGDSQTHYYQQQPQQSMYSAGVASPNVNSNPENYQSLAYPPPSYEKGGRETAGAGAAVDGSASSSSSGLPVSNNNNNYNHYNAPQIGERTYNNTASEYYRENNLQSPNQAHYR